ncbi:MAG: L-serine ammonia-lyase, iron-sulfur-dependent subunit beta [Clostridia bacterium]
MSKNLSVFDITGPIMIGPSSSHTAGACRLGYSARKILGEDPISVTFHLYGSFKATLEGHGTDRALLGGVLGFMPDDEEIRNSFKIAKMKNLEYKFIKEDDQADHPNTVKIELAGLSGSKKVVKGRSVGGGNILITQIDQTSLQIDGKYHTLVTRHWDRVGIVQEVTGILYKNNINIAQMSLYREDVNDQAYMIIDVDNKINPECLEAVLAVNKMEYAIIIEKLY